mgnify:FL=1|tara:strand:+ start:1018 stop:2013 length:996 start_codon:yes stop_codon:yes gene_type:complete
MIFEYLNYAFVCLAVLFLVIIFSFYRSNQYMIFDNRNFSKKFYKNLFIGNSSSITIKTIIRYLGILCLVISISGIKTGITVKPVERKGVDIVFCIDVSLSMDSQDIKPSRIDKVKFELSKIVDNLEGDRIGVVVFSGSNFLYLPLTMDYDASKLFIKSIDTSMISSRGTDIPNAIKTSVEAFGDEDNQQKMIFLFTDGEDHSNLSIDDISYLISEKINLHVIGVGSSTGSLIPLRDKENSFLKNESGELVLSKLNLNFLREISTLNNGNLLRISKSEPISENVVDIIKKGEDSLISSFEFSDYEHKFQYPLAIAIFLLMVSHLISSGKRKK